ncbi:hypothetical protein [Litchfieldella xinjiangensis]|uniref:NADH-quinone oxidoreductase subunit D-related protein n=1 Tax=Litchfieldella xinjiangensis TaxID=1166948 RepID=UPI0005BCC171|nr:hypothetical protein [Halomonas xinjiangensis]
MAVSWLRKLAARGPARVFLAQGEHSEGVREYLALSPAVQLVDSPRHASVLLVAGEVPIGWRDDLRRVHDQLPAPFASVWYQSDPFDELISAPRVDTLEALPETLLATHRDLVLQRRGSSPRLLPDVPPNPWQGLGDDGHGGEGMMGGNPYGRPMAMNMQDDRRDGLTLDTLTFRLGPFHPGLPPGMQAETSLQGDLIQTWETQKRPFPESVDLPFHAARERPVSIAELERARARHHLHRLHLGLHLAGWPGLANQVLRLASDLAGQPNIAGLRRQLIRGGFFRLAQPMPGHGRLDDETVHQVGGWMARAAGVGEDARSQDASYRRLGFTPICQAEGDTASRWRQLLDETQQSIDLAHQAERLDLATANTELIETPRGPWGEDAPDDASQILEEVLPGLEWGEAMATLASLELAALETVPGEGALANQERRA